MEKVIDKFINDQLSIWPMVSNNYRALKTIESKHLIIDGLEAVVQFNPGRIISATAAVDEQSVKERPCFLCEPNRPKEQNFLPFEGRKGRKYHILVNQYPIFPKHLVITLEKHTEQSIWHHYVDMLDMAHQFSDYVIFYNGPKCGASAPDHFHFQACPKGLMPLEVAVDALLDHPVKDDMEYLCCVQDAQLYHYKHFTKGIFALKARTSKSMAKQLYRLLDSIPMDKDDKEPKFNLLTYFKKGEYRAIVICRGAHRPHQFYSEGPDKMTVSPGCVDMAGVVVAPTRADYDRMDTETLSSILSEVSVSEEVEKEIIWRLVRTQPKIEVGIMSAAQIIFEIISDGAGPQKVSYQEGKINYNGALYDELVFEARTMSTLFAEPSFILHDVTIGINFHWERKQVQKFAGSLKFIVEKNQVTAVNVVGVEDYLLSVISSEMKSSATLEFLKAHAVISRSWVMSQISGHKDSSGRITYQFDNVPGLVTYLDSELTSGKAIEEDRSTQMPTIIRWSDHEDHKHFDVCADDHCQRYQGLTMAVGDTVRKAIDLTWGEVLTYDGKICDARFSKCCGGVMERFSSCWNDIEYPYLQGRLDTPGDQSVPDLTTEEGARRWIMMQDPKAADAFCNTKDNAILSQVLNDYDMETGDFFRWSVTYDIAAISKLISERSGVDIGELVDLIPLERGASGRIVRLRIVGSKASMEIGKELIIRRYLSETHLKSSAFVVDFGQKDGVRTLTLTGAGWGHGVGLCQIGAAVMAFRGYSYREILSHYYPDSHLARQ